MGDGQDWELNGLGGKVSIAVGNDWVEDARDEGKYGILSIGTYGGGFQI